MIIAVTRDNSDLINQVCNTLKHDVKGGILTKSIIKQDWQMGLG